MKAADATLLLPAPTWSDPRARLLDDTWLLTIFAILLASALPWVLSDFAVDLAGAAMGLLALAAIHLAFAALINPARSPSVLRVRALAATHAIGIIVIAYIWHHVGGLQNPAFLLVFVLPVVGAIFLTRWQPYLIASLAVVAVAIVALLEAPELRWYASGLNKAGGWIASLFGRQGAALSAPFPGLYAPSGYFLVMLEVFAVVLFACAVAAEYLGTVFNRLHEHVLSARVEAERAEELWTALITHLPLPALLVDANSMQVICASQIVEEKFAKDQAPPGGQRLFEAIQFSYPEVLQELIAGVGGIARLTVIHVRGQLKITDVHVQHMAQRGRRFALLLIEEKTEAFCIKAALDTADQAALVLDSRGDVLAFNKPALALFPAANTGLNASKLLAQPGAASNWWQPSLTGRLKMHMTISQRLYQVTSSSLALPGEEEQIFAVAFRPMPKDAALDDTGLTATTMQLS